MATTAGTIPASEQLSLDALLKQARERLYYEHERLNAKITAAVRELEEADREVKEMTELLCKHHADATPGGRHLQLLNDSVMLLREVTRDDLLESHLATLARGAFAERRDVSTAT